MMIFIINFLLVTPVLSFDTLEGAVQTNFTALVEVQVGIVLFNT